MHRLLFIVLLVSCTVGELPADLGEDDASNPERVALGPPLVWPRLARGDSNQDVTTLQYLLGQAGFQVPKTGTFDAATDAGVRDFQRSRSLLVDGIVGEQTWLGLVTVIDQGDVGDAVSGAQYLLARRFGASIEIDGVFGAVTRTRVEGFQSSMCLEDTGIIGLYTWNALIARRSYCSGSNTGGAANRVLAAHQAGTLTLWDQTFGRHDGADPLSNIRDAAANRPARTSCYGGAPCTTVRLASGLVNGMAALREQHGYQFFVTSIAGASHSSGSYHYAGRAFDIDMINGVKISGDSALARGFMAACRTLGAIEVLGPNNDPGHQDHIHCAW